jgi:modulator of FtsH protease HflK
MAQRKNLSSDDESESESPYQSQNSSYQPKDPEMVKLMKNIRLGVKIGLGAVVGLTALIGGCQSFYTVDQDSQAVVTRLGAYKETTNPGLNFKLPFWIDNAKIQPVRKVQKMEFGFRTTKSGVDSTFITSDSPGIKPDLVNTLREEERALTGDLNIADVEWICQYKIKDPVAYTFNLKDPEETIRDVNLDVMKRIMGDGSIDEALIMNRTEYEARGREEMQKLLDGYNSGVEITAINLQSTNPPRPVRPSFNEVSTAMQEMETKINQARKVYNDTIPLAGGEAEKTVKDAEGFAVQRTNEAKGDVLKFYRQYQAYKSAPEITGNRIYFEAMKKFLPNVAEVNIIEQKGVEGGVLLFKDLGKGANK